MPKRSTVEGCHSNWSSRKAMLMNMQIFTNEYSCCIIMEIATSTSFKDKCIMYYGFASIICTYKGTLICHSVQVLFNTCRLYVIDWTHPS